MFKAILAACAALTLTAQVAVTYISVTTPRAYAAIPSHTQVVVTPISVEPPKVESEVSIKEILYDDEDLDCMTKNIYFEARDQSVEGQFAVAEVVMNRVSSEEFPKTVCEVIKQKSSTNCQFSWYCDGLSDVMHDKDAENRARMIARTALSFKTNFTDGAKYYHADYVSPGWTEAGKVKQIQDHIFYTRI
jgi:spore germination cell wall hydrolase CwlJ-like protein